MLFNATVLVTPVSQFAFLLILLFSNIEAPEISTMFCRTFISLLLFVVKALIEIEEIKEKEICNN